MNDHLHPLEGLANRQFSLVGYLMGLDQGELIVELQMQLHEAGRPGLAGTQIMYAMHPLYGTAERHYSRLFFLWQLTIEQGLYGFVANMGGPPH